MSVTCRYFGLSMNAGKASCETAGADYAWGDPRFAGDRYPLPTMARLSMPRCDRNANVRWRHEHQ